MSRPAHITDPERKCLVSGEVSPKRGLIRFVLGPDDTIYPDMAGKLPGRGMYVAADRAALDTAVKKRLFSKGAKRQVSLPDGLIDDVEQALVRRVLDRISMARKAGDAVAGFERVKEWLDRDRAAILLQASDGSERGKSKLYRPGGRGSFFDILTAQELGLSFGRERVIHAALAAGRLADLFRDDAVRLSGVRTSETQDDGNDPVPGKVKKTR
ncbi:RNA-binding protein [Palleronia salina]|nr:RNA-binding protein [Palleronia salina]